MSSQSSLASNPSDASNSVEGITKLTANDSPPVAVAQSQVDTASGVAALTPGRVVASNRGGTGIDTSGATDGQILIGKTSDHSLNLSTLTAGTGITITNGAGLITVTNSAGGVSLTTASNYLVSDVTMTSSNTYYDGASVSLVAGTWFITAAIQVKGGALADATAKIWDGTTNYSSGESVVALADYVSIFLSAIVSPGTTTTYKVSAAQNTAGGLIKAAAAQNAAGNTATYINAIKIA